MPKKPRTTDGKAEMNSMQGLIRVSVRGDLVDVDRCAHAERNGEHQSHQRNHQRAHKERQDAVPVLPKAGRDPVVPEQKRRDPPIPRDGQIRIPALELLVNTRQGGDKIPNLALPVAKLFFHRRTR